ncbi:hypothetical protein BJ165DRAFT_1515366 [Panaeolus papilionaceus]|nr:hypothetical protein BJ165DRAFT_1515366 [Panaeolus papilionaceus]
MTRQTPLLVSLIPLGLCRDHLLNILPLAGASHHPFITITPAPFILNFILIHPPSPPTTPLRFPLLILLVNLPLQFPQRHPVLASASVVISLTYHRHRSPFYAQKKHIITYHPRGCRRRPVQPDNLRPAFSHSVQPFHSAE